MSDGDDGDDELAVVDLMDGAVVADADTPGVAASELFTTRRGSPSSSSSLSSMRGAKALGSLLSCSCAEGRMRTVYSGFLAFVFVGWHRVGGWVFLFWL